MHCYTVGSPLFNSDLATKLNFWRRPSFGWAGGCQGFSRLMSSWALSGEPPPPLHMATLTTASLGGQPPPLSLCSPILGVPFSYAYTFWGIMAKFHVVTHLMRRLVIGRQPHHLPKGPSLDAPASIFGGSPHLYLCLHPFDVERPIRHVNTYGEGRVLGSQPRCCILQKWVVRFVSDIWVSCYQSCSSTAQYCHW